MQGLGWGQPGRGGGGGRRGAAAVAGVAHPRLPPAGALKWQAAHTTALSDLPGRLGDAGQGGHAGAGLGAARAWRRRGAAGSGGGGRCRPPSTAARRCAEVAGCPPHGSHGGLLGGWGRRGKGGMQGLGWGQREEVAHVMATRHVARRCGVWRGGHVSIPTTCPPGSPSAWLPEASSGGAMGCLVGVRCGAAHRPWHERRGARPSDASLPWWAAGLGWGRAPACSTRPSTRCKWVVRPV